MATSRFTWPFDRAAGSAVRSPDRYVLGLIVLRGMTLWIHRLLRPYKNGWPLSALSSGLVSLAVLLWSAG